MKDAHLVAVSNRFYGCDDFLSHFPLPLILVCLSQFWLIGCSNQETSRNATTSLNDSLYLEAVNQLNRHDYDSAMALYARLTSSPLSSNASDSSLLFAYCDYAKMLAYSGKWREACQWYQSVLSYGQTFPDKRPHPKVSLAEANYISLLERFNGADSVIGVLGRVEHEPNPSPRSVIAYSKALLERPSMDVYDRVERLIQRVLPNASLAERVHLLLLQRSSLALAKSDAAQKKLALSLNDYLKSLSLSEASEAEWLELKEILDIAVLYPPLKESVVRWADQRLTEKSVDMSQPAYAWLSLFLDALEQRGTTRSLIVKGIVEEKGYPPLRLLALLNSGSNPAYSLSLRKTFYREALSQLEEIARLPDSPFMKMLIRRSISDYRECLVIERDILKQWEVGERAEMIEFALRWRSPSQLNALPVSIQSEPYWGIFLELMTLKQECIGLARLQDEALFSQDSKEREWRFASLQTILSEKEGEFYSNCETLKKMKRQAAEVVLPTPTSLTQLQSVLTDSTLLIDFFFGQSQSVATIISNKKVDVLSLPITMSMAESLTVEIISGICSVSSPAENTVMTHPERQRLSESLAAVLQRCASGSVIYFTSNVTLPLGILGTTAMLQLDCSPVLVLSSKQLTGGWTLSRSNELRVIASERLNESRDALYLINAPSVLIFESSLSPLESVFFQHVSEGLRTHNDLPYLFRYYTKRLAAEENYDGVNFIPIGTHER